MSLSSVSTSSSPSAASASHPQWVKTFFTNPWYDLVFPVDREWSQRHAQALQRLTGLPHATFLDQCCGQGWLAHHLVQQGWSGVAVDQSLPTTLQLALRAPARLQAVCADAGQYRVPEKVDVAFNWHTSLGYGGREGMHALLERLGQSVHAQGHVVLDVRHVEQYQQQPLRARQQVLLPEGEASLWRSNRWEGQTLHQRWQVLRGVKVLWEHETSCYHPSLAELLDWFRTAPDLRHGQVSWYANIDLEPFLPTSPRLLVHWKGQ